MLIAKHSESREYKEHLYYQVIPQSTDDHYLMYKSVRGAFLCLSHTHTDIHIHEHIHPQTYTNVTVSQHINIYVYFWRRKWQPTPIFLPGKSHGLRSLEGCSSWGRKESDTTERLSTSTCVFLNRKESKI